MRTLLIGLVLAALMATPAQAVTITGPAWAQQAVDRMRVPVAPGQTVLLEPCPGYESEAAACNFTSADSPIYIDPQQFFDIPADMRETLYRELGGRFDTLAMYPWAVEHFERILNRKVRPLTVGTTAWYGVSETFEDAYADCALGLTPRTVTLHRDDGGWVDTAGYEPSAKQHARVCTLIARVGVHARYQTPVSVAPPGPSESSRSGSAQRP